MDKDRLIEILTCDKCGEDFEYDYYVASGLCCDHCGTTICPDCFFDMDYECPGCPA